MLTKYLPNDTNFAFMGLRYPALILSAVLLVASIALVPLRGLNFGIDFVGGVVIEAETQGEVQMEQVRSVLDGLDLGDYQLQEKSAEGGMGSWMIRTEGAGELSQDEMVAWSVSARAVDRLEDRFEKVSLRRQYFTGTETRPIDGVLIDFERTDKDMTIEAVERILNSLDLGQVSVEEGSEAALLDDELPINFIVARISAIDLTAVPEEIDLEEISEAKVQATAGRILNALETAFGEIDVRRNDAVGPKVSGELLRSGVWALTIALGLMLLYIWFRFEWQYSLGAVAALVHDVVLTIGMFAVTQFEFNLQTIAALLTIVGYSMNDTVVVFDRVREEVRKYKKLPLDKVINIALNQTLSRTTLTSGTTLLALFSIFFFGGDVLRGFSFALIWGVVIGTYSSIFIASALLLYTGIRRGPPAQTEPEGAPQPA